MASRSDEEEPQYDEDEEDIPEEDDEDIPDENPDEEYEDDDEEEDEEYEDEAAVRGVRVATKGEEEDEEDEEDEEEEEEEEDEEDEDEEYEDPNAVDLAVLQSRAGELLSNDQTTEAIQVLKELTRSLFNKLPELPYMTDRISDFRLRVLYTLSLWTEAMKDSAAMHQGKQGDLIDSLSSWFTAFIENDILSLEPQSDEAEEEDESESELRDKEVVKEFSELLYGLQQPPAKKKKRG